MRLVTAALVLLSTSPVWSQDGGSGPRVTAVDLAQSGLALYRLTMEAEGAGPLTFAVPRGDGDDVAASLVVSDPAGGVVGITTQTPRSRAEAVRGTPFAGGLPGDLAALARNLVGARVTVTTPERSVSGTVLGVSEVEIVEDETVVKRPVALVFDGTRAVAVTLAPGTGIAVEDEAAGQLADAAAATPERTGERRFQLTLEGEGEREVTLSYVTPAPAWKNSWRLLLDQGKLQGWATVENVSGRDWQDVRLTLSTGLPVAYRRDLLAPRRTPRLEPPDLLGARPNVAADPGFAARARRAPAAPAAQESGVLGLLREAAPSAPARAAEVAEGVAAVRYTVPEPVDLAAGRTATLPYLEVAVEPDIHAFYRPQTERRVVLAARVAAEQALAPGLVSIRDADGFVGDAPFTGLAADQARLLPYAAAPGAVVRESRSEVEATIDVSAGDDLLQTEIARTTRTTYAATLPEGVDVFTVEHPKGDGELVRASGEVSEKENAWRVSTEVPAADGEAEASIEIVERDVVRQRLDLSEEGLARLLALVGDGRLRLDDADRPVLDEAAAALRALRDARAREARLGERYDRLVREQARLRENLKAVEDGALRERYRTQLGETEDEIATVLDERRAAEEAAETLREALEAAVRKFS